MHPERPPRSRLRPRALACVLAASAALGTRAARADALVDLRWKAPPGCPESSAVEAQLRSIVNRSARLTSGLRADGEITRVGDRYRLTLLVFDGDARRERIIDSDSCTALAGAAAVTLSILLRGEKGQTDATAPASGDARATASGDTSASSPAGEKAPPPPRPESKPSPAAAEAPEDDQANRDSAGGPRPWRFVLRAPLGAVDAGLLTDADLSVGGGLGFRYWSWHVGAAVRFFAAETVTASNPTGVGASVDRIALDVWGCRTWAAGPLELGPCLTLGVDRFSARGSGPRVEGRSQNFVALAPGAGLQAHLQVAEWLAVFASGSLGLETSRARLSIDGGVGELERLGSTRLTAGLGTEWVL